MIEFKDGILTEDLEWIPKEEYEDYIDCPNCGNYKVRNIDGGFCYNCGFKIKAGDEQ